MDAKEYLASVTNAAKTLQIEQQRQDLHDLATQTYSSSSIMGGGRGGDSDKYASIDAYVDSEKFRSERIQEARNEIAQARQVFDGMRTIGYLEAESANVLEAIHIDLLTIGDTALGLHASYSTVRRRYRYGVEWLDSHGLAHAKAGLGIAT